jgi:membrane fusion protein (multidrug efflux system)
MKETEEGKGQSTALLEREKTERTERANRAPGDTTVRTETPAGRPDATAAPAEADSGGGTDSGKEKRKAPAWVKPAALVALLAAVVIGGLWGVRYWRFATTHISTDDAYLTTDVVQITPQVAGNVAQVLVAENQQVHRGQLLAVLDDATYRAAVEQAKANLAVAEASAQGAASSVGLTEQTGSAQIEQASGGVAQAESAVGAAQADVERARAAIANAQAGTATAQSNVQTAEAGLESALVGRQRAVEAVRGAQAQLETAKAGVLSAQAAVTAAQANAEKAEKDRVRYASLYSQDAVSAQTVDTATAAATAARAQVDSAQQQVAQAQAVVAQRRSDVSIAQEQVRAADAAIAEARAQVSAAQNAVRAAQANTRQSQAQLLSAQQNVTAAQAKRTQALGQLNQARTAPKQVAVSQANHQTANARIQEAQAALDSAEIDLQRTRIYAPTGGVVSKKTVEVGQQVAVGQALMAIIPNNDIWVVANFKETQMKSVRAGQPAEIAVDAVPGVKFTGRVNSIAAATGATFALLPPDNATGNFTKVVQRVPVKITFEPNQPGLDRLRGGLSAVATIATH